MPKSPKSPELGNLRDVVGMVEGCIRDGLVNAGGGAGTGVVAWWVVVAGIAARLDAWWRGGPRWGGAGEWG